MGDEANRGGPRRPFQPARRRFLVNAGRAGAMAALASPLAVMPGRAKASESVVFVAWGGTTQASQEEIFVKPFMEETGIPVISASGPDLAKIKAMVQTRNVEWDLVSLTGSMAQSLAREDMLEPIPDWVYDPDDIVNPAWVADTAIGWYYYTGGICFDPERHPAGRHPRDWQEFWDVEGIPGRRGLRPRPEENLEIALLADGVAPKDVYPMDVDRAFAAMDRLKPHVAVWIRATPQTITLVQANEVDFNFTYTGRVADAREQGISVDIALDAPVSSPGYLAVPKGARNKEAAFKLLKVFMREDTQAVWAASKDGYAPQSKRAMQSLAPEVLARLHTPDHPKGLFIDVDWWGEHYTEVANRFKEWMLV
jgi:putative spermidine/putrescine transport system substrate-binding protein